MTLKTPSATSTRPVSAKTPRITSTRRGVAKDHCASRSGRLATRVTATFLSTDQIARRTSFSHRERRPRGAHQDPALEGRRDGVRNEGLRHDGVLRALVARVGHDADDLEDGVRDGRVRRRPQLLQLDRAPDRVVGPEEAAAERLVHHRDLSRAGDVHGGQHPAAPEPQPERLEVALRAELVDRLPALAGGAGPERPPPTGCRRREGPSSRRVAASTPGSARRRLRTWLEVLLLGGGRGVGAARQRRADVQHALRIEAHVRGLQLDEAAHQQTRAGEQDQRERDLGGHERPVQPAPAVPAAATLARVLERVDEVVARGAQRRHQAADDGRHERDAAG